MDTLFQELRATTYSNLKSQSRISFNSAERTEFFRPVFEAAVKPPVALEASATTEDQLDEQSLETLPEVPLADCRRLTEKEEKRLRRKEDAKLRELRIFLRYEPLELLCTLILEKGYDKHFEPKPTLHIFSRDIWQKINREQKFFMFRTAVDTEEVNRDHCLLICFPLFNNFKLLYLSRLNTL